MAVGTPLVDGTVAALGHASGGLHRTWADSGYVGTLADSDCLEEPGGQLVGCGPPVLVLKRMAASRCRRLGWSGLAEEGVISTRMEGVRNRDSLDHMALYSGNAVLSLSSSTCLWRSLHLHEKLDIY